MLVLLNDEIYLNMMYTIQMDVVALIPNLIKIT
jgi:hypothetical protein